MVLFLFIAFVLFAELIVPLLRDLIIFLVQFLFMALCQALKLIATGLLWMLLALCRAIARLLAAIARLLWDGLVFLSYVAHEWCRGEPAGDCGAGDAAQDEEDEAPVRDPYAEALALLGLTVPLTLAELNKAYKRAIRKAHPDAGGSVAAAQAVNLARDEIVRVHGW